MPGLPISKNITQTKKSSQEPSKCQTTTFNNGCLQPLGSRLLEAEDEEEKEPATVAESYQKIMMGDPSLAYNTQDSSKGEVVIQAKHTDFIKQQLLHEYMAQESQPIRADEDAIKSNKLQTPLQLAGHYSSIEISNQLDRLNTKREETDLFNEGNSPVSSDATVVQDLEDVFQESINPAVVPLDCIRQQKDKSEVEPRQTTAPNKVTDGQKERNRRQRGDD